MVSYVEVGGKGLAAEEKPAQVTLSREGGQLGAEDEGIAVAGGTMRR